MNGFSHGMREDGEEPVGNAHQAQPGYKYGEMTGLMRDVAAEPVLRDQFFKTA